MSTKTALKRVLPSAAVRAGSWALDRALPARRANLARSRDREKRARVVSRLISLNGPIVQGGPFAGLRLPEGGSWGTFAPLLVGSYEAELHALLEELIRSSPTRIINVGCAEGYYAVGLALRLPDAEVHAFDADDRGRQLTRYTAGINGVAERVHVRAGCTVEALEELLTPESLLIVDCEGCERELLQPDLVPSLREATVLVELHDFIDPEISSMVLARFQETHATQLWTVGNRVIGDYPVLRRLPRADRAAAIDEGRPTEPHPMEWAVFRPRPSA
jgi:O-methyltransferase